MKLTINSMVRLFQRSHYMSLLKPKAAQRYIERLLRDAEELHHILHQYPDVRYEPLDDFYILFLYLGGLDLNLIRDLCEHLTYRGIALASFLAAIRPSNEYREVLVLARPRAPHNAWLVDLAIAEIDGTDSIDNADLQLMIRNLRKAIEGVALPTVKFRSPFPTPEEMALRDAALDEFKRLYHAGDLAAANDSLRRRLPDLF